jgi:hypothetical protein
MVFEVTVAGQRGKTQFTGDMMYDVPHIGHGPEQALEPLMIILLGSSRTVLPPGCLDDFFYEFRVQGS